MSSSLLTLGPFSFEGLESPESIQFKAKQRIAVHHLGSGLSTIDYLGDDYETVSFRGVFSGPGASARIRSIDHLRVLGEPLVLSWNSKTLSVIIRQFELDYSSDRWIPYRLSCYVLRSVLHPDDPIDLMLASPGTQISEIFRLLEGTGVSPTSAQGNGLLTLAMLDFDAPPAEAYSQAQVLMNAIDDQLAAIDGSSQNDPPVNAGSATDEAAYFTALVANYGQQTALTLGRNRVMSVLTCAEDVSQQ